MKLTDKEKKLLQQSVDHWQEDIINKFIGGNKPDRFCYNWTKSKEIVRDRNLDCPLCQEYNDLCSYCLYYKFYNISCECLHWNKWKDEQTKESAIAMRDALQAILDSESNWCDKKQVFCNL